MLVYTTSCGSVSDFNSHVENCHSNDINKQLLVFRVKRLHISVVIRENMFITPLEFMTVLEDKKEFQ